MRICHVITKPELGGAQLSTLNLIFCLPKDKYQISVITSSNGILKHEFKNLENVTAYFSPFLALKILNSLKHIPAQTKRLSQIRNFLSSLHIRAVSQQAKAPGRALWKRGFGDDSLLYSNSWFFPPRTSAFFRTCLCQDFNTFFCHFQDFCFFLLYNI